MCSYPIVSREVLSSQMLYFPVFLCIDQRNSGQTTANVSRKVNASGPAWLRSVCAVSTLSCPYLALLEATCFFILFCFFVLELAYYITLVSGEQHSESTFIHVYLRM